MKSDQAASTVDLQTRFDQLQTRFIDEPREAVREASTLVREAVDRLFSGEHDTEQLRRVMQGYRDLLARIDGRQPGAMSSSENGGPAARRAGRDPVPERSEPAGRRAGGDAVPEERADS